jgi:hypothetical protein
MKRLVIIEAWVRMWGRFPTCSGFSTRLDDRKQTVERRLKTGAQDAILPHIRE